LLSIVFIGAGPASPQSAGGSPSRSEAFTAGPAALAAVQNRLGAPLEILRIVIGPDFVDVDARDPRQSMHVDRHHYAEGRLESPEPVAVGRNERQLRARLFPLAPADLARVPDLLRPALAEVRAEDGLVQQITIDRQEGSGDNPSWGRPIFRVHVSGPRSGGYVEFRLDGRRGRVVRW
jgi:hypothetical protein